jgi:hypothetical protein
VRSQEVCVAGKTVAQKARAEKLDLRPLGLVGIDDMWSAFRLRRARPVRSGKS